MMLELCFVGIFLFCIISFIIYCSVLTKKSDLLKVFQFTENICLLFCFQQNDKYIFIILYQSMLSVNSKVYGKQCHFGVVGWFGFFQQN